MNKAIAIFTLFLISTAPLVKSEGDPESDYYTAPLKDLKNKLPMDAPIMRQPTSQAIRIPCDSKEYVADLIEREHGEKVLFDASGIIYGIPPGKPPAFARPLSMDFTVYVNQDTGKWSFVGHSNGFACMIIAGTNFVAGGN